MIPYINNKEIARFINRAQNKIADLASLIVKRGGYLPDALTLLLELSDFIECLDNEFNTWTERDIIKWIHSYNQRANLNSIPYLCLLRYETSIITGEGGISLPITVSDISDYVPATNQLIRNTPHNSLSLIQGGTINERYHLTKAQLDWIVSQMNPFVSPTVSLSLLATPNVAWQEKGTVVNTINLQGAYTLNSGGSLVSYNYKRIGRVPDIIFQDTNSIISSFTHREGVRFNTTFRFEATFTNGGTITSDQQVNFIAPMWYGIRTRSSTAADIQALNKIVEAPSNVHDFIFQLPPDNTARSLADQVVPYILVPKSKGTLSRFEVLTFDTKPDWGITSVNVPLLDGTIEPCWLCEFKNTVVGTYDFKVLWS